MRGTLNPWSRSGSIPSGVHSEPRSSKTETETPSPTNPLTENHMNPDNATLSDVDDLTEITI